MSGSTHGSDMKWDSDSEVRAVKEGFMKEMDSEGWTGFERRGMGIQVKGAALSKCWETETPLVMGQY